MMKRIFVIVLMMIVLFTAAITTNGENSLNNQMIDAEYYGQLHIDEAGIHVAVYNDARQEIVDFENSAVIFKLSGYNDLIIADHRSQSFSNLPNVRIGMYGVIDRENKDDFHIQCVDVLDGHNTKQAITDEEYNIVHNRADITMYTCKDNAQNVLICLWDIIE